MDTSTSSSTLLGRVTARLAALVTWPTASGPTKPTVHTETTQSTIAAGSQTPAPLNEPSKPDTVVLSASESGSGSTRKMRQICWTPDNLTDEEAAAMCDYLRGKYGLPFVMDKKPQGPAKSGPVRV